MKIYAEYILLSLLIFIFLVIILSFKISKIRALKKYNINNDKGKIGEEKRKEAIRNSIKRKQIATRPPQVKERRILQTTDVGVVRKNSKGIRARLRRRKLRR